MQTLTVTGGADAPIAWLFLPMLPLVLILVRNDLVLSSLKITLDIAVLVSLAITLVCEYCRRHKACEVMAGIQKVLDSMSSVFAIIMILIITDEVFSAGLKAIGAVDVLLSLFGEFGLSAAFIILLMTLITFTISALMGSGNVAFFSFAPMVPDISRHISSDIAIMMLPIQISTGTGRTLPPIAGVIIAIAGIAGISPVDIVKRTAIPMLSGWLLMVALTFTRSGHLLAILPWLAALVLLMVGGYLWQRRRKQPLAVQ